VKIKEFILKIKQNWVDNRGFSKAWNSLSFKPFQLIGLVSGILMFMGVSAIIVVLSVYVGEPYVEFQYATEFHQLDLLVYFVLAVCILKISWYLHSKVYWEILEKELNKKGYSMDSKLKGRVLEVKE